MDEQAPHTQWIDGRIVDDEPRPAGSAWVWLAAVLLLVMAIDLALGLGSGEQAPQAATDGTAIEDVRAELQAAVAAADAGRPAYVLIGDSVLAGDVMATRVPDWRSQRVIDHMRAELSPDGDAALQQVTFDGLLPIDALGVLAELDRLDPAGEVQLVLELNLRYFSPHYAEHRECTRAELCELGRPRVIDREPLAQASAGLIESGERAADWLLRWAPIHRHRAQLERVDLAALDGLAVARTSPEPPHTPTRAEGLARVQAHYRGSSISERHAQVEALIELLDRLAARGRPATLFVTPLDDAFASATLPGNGLGRRHQQLAALIHDRGNNVHLIDLDHPLFGSTYFLDHVHLDPEGNRLLAINLLHELGLPLRKRPFEWMMVHDEDHDRSLVHRRGVGFADGSAWRALFRAPEGVAVSRSGDWIVIADTGNHVLRQLRGNMQIVERLAGTPRRAGSRDGLAAQAQLERPRSPEIVGEAVYFLDGDGSNVRALAHGVVATLDWSGPGCDGFDELEARTVDGRAWLYLLCADDRVLELDLDARTAAVVFDPQRHRSFVGVRGLEPTDDGRLLLADDRSRIWSLPLDQRGRPPKLLFGNTATELLPNEFKKTYPFAFDEMRVNRVVGMEWVERYGMLLIQDEHDLGRGNDRLHREQTERIHLRLLDFDARQIYPWIKAIPHGEAFHMWNEVTQNLVSYYHLGAMAIAQRDASLVYLERKRSRLFRIADGMLAAAKTGNLHTNYSKIELFQTIGTQTSKAISASLRPDRFLDTRHEPVPRAGPYVALLIGSSLSAVTDRIGNYSIARLLELELQAELGYRDGIRLDVYQRTHSAISLGGNGDAFDEYMNAAGPPPDIVLFEVHDFQRRYFRDCETRPERLAVLGRIERLAARYDTLVIFFDNSAIEANGRDGLRASSNEIDQLFDDVRKLGFVVLQPSDQLLRELLVESPWSSQPWGKGNHHGAPWAIELTAKTYASLAYPVIREFLRGRTPARRHERDPFSFAQQGGRAGLVDAFAATEGLVNRAALPELRGSFVQRRYQDGKLELLVDLAGARKLARDQAGFESLALAVLYTEIETEVYGPLAERVDIELLEFENYDEYGEGVRDAAAVAWRASMDRDQLEQLIRRVAERQGGSR